MYSHRNSGVFVGAIWATVEASYISKENAQLKQELNHHKKVESLHIGKVVFACKYNGFYTGEITEIIHKKRFTTIELNGKETFDIGMIYTNKEEALQQIKI